MALSENDFYACYQRLERPLFNVLYRMIWNRHDCEDLLHDAYLRVWQRRKRIDEDKVDALVWTVALNLARNRIRWQQLWRTETFDADWPDTEPTPDVVVDGLTQQRQLHKALGRLPAAMRDVVLLGEFTDLSQADIAAVLHVPPGTVASRRHHALIMLHTLLTKDQNE